MEAFGWERIGKMKRNLESLAEARFDPGPRPEEELDVHDLSDEGPMETWHQQAELERNRLVVLSVNHFIGRKVFERWKVLVVLQALEFAWLVHLSTTGAASSRPKHVHVRIVAEWERRKGRETKRDSDNAIQ